MWHRFRQAGMGILDREDDMQHGSNRPRLLATSFSGALDAKGKSAA